MCHADVNWVDSLPLVLLGIRSAFKEDLNASSAELVYGEPLRLPGEFFQSAAPDSTDITDFSTRLRQFAAKLQPSPATHHKKDRIFIYKDLASSSHVFLRDDSVRGALQPPYSGPYEVLERGDKIFKLLVKGKPVTVSIDRLKPAYILADPSTTPQTITDPTPILLPIPVPMQTDIPAQDTAKKTRSGRVVRFPDYYRP
ncbi:uncharacterized protein LOC131842210 [Achroia grisella]|uniref:uncharacterized protein LOC131842210 n=1 Tax=Achroia grisella TaxID=688607 RepID=UPI0027D28956|nr:uncharacterized protein LOC131842210 [Achroia grisella]